MNGFADKGQISQYAESERRHDEEGDDPSSPHPNCNKDTTRRSNILLAAYRSPVHVLRTENEN